MDSGFCTLNYLGFTDGSGASWVNVIGGAVADNYYYQLKQYPSDTNGWAICGAGNNMGNELPFDNVNVTGQYIGFESGILDLYNCLAQYCSNALDCSISPGVYTKVDMQLGGCFNGLTVQPCADGLSGPSLLNLVFNDCGQNLLPAGTQFHVINDQLFKRTTFDGFFGSSGSITVYTNFNTGGLSPPDFVWNFTSANQNLADYLVRTVGANGQWNTPYGQENKAYEVVTNMTINTLLTIGPSGVIVASTGLGDAIRLTGSASGLNFGGNASIIGRNVQTAYNGGYSFPNLQANSIDFINAPFGTMLPGPAQNPDGTWVCPTNAYFDTLIVVTNINSSGPIVPVLATGFGTVVQTNWIIGGKYSFTYPVLVQGNAVLTLAAVTGASDLDLEINGIVTNSSAIQSTALTIAMVYTNNLTGYVPANTTFDFTNRSGGAGNSAAVVRGQYIIQ